MIGRTYERFALSDRESPLLREAIEAANWHIVKSVHLRSVLARDPLELGDLEPYLGLDPAIERSAEQMALFGG